VLISNYSEYYRLTSYIRRYTKEMIGVAMGINNLVAQLGGPHALGSKNASLPTGSDDSVEKSHGSVGGKKDILVTLSPIVPSRQASIVEVFRLSAIPTSYIDFS
jgi:hypothetical protein